MSLISFFKKRCLICAKATCESHSLCEFCLERLKVLKPCEICMRCGINLPNRHPLCGQCLQNPPYFSETHAIWEYDALSSHLIQRLKFHEDFSVLPFLVESFKKRLQVDYQNRPFPESVLPVPLHSFKLFRRGFNQTAEIAKCLAKEFDLHFDNTSLRKIKATKAQSALHIKDRARNLQSAFTVQKSFIPQSVALVDDVMTTGATANEISRVLKQAGVEEVHIWVLARALKYR